MPNNYFRFKRFIVNQDKAAMKVCTDACLFGAWVARHINAPRVLDIGTGTGLLSLMMAQQSEAIIDAVEIDKNAYVQATENFKESPWSERLNIYHVAIQDYDNDQYDLIISNPPFFNNDLKSPDTARNLALHSEALSLQELLVAVKRLLKNEGIFAVLLPYHRANYFEQLLEDNSLAINKKMLVRQTGEHPYFRVFYFVSRNKTAFSTEEIVIKNAENKYTEPFTALLKDYYLDERDIIKQ